MDQSFPSSCFRIPMPIVQTDTTKDFFVVLLMLHRRQIMPRIRFR